MADQDPDDQEVLDRRLNELLAEVRVILPTATVLFAFLLTIPFTTRFAATTEAERGAYLTAFLGTALAIICVLGGSAYHRVRGKPYDKAALIRTANRQALAAIALLAVSLPCVVFLVADVVYPGGLAVPLAVAIFVFALATWFGLPLIRRLRGR